MSAEIIARCGLVCSECDAYVAHKSNDLTALTKMANDFNKQFGGSMTAEDTRCDGCITDDGYKIPYCGKCEIRACAGEHKVLTCAHCDDYACDVITTFLEKAPKAKVKLAAIRRTL